MRAPRRLLPRSLLRLTLLVRSMRPSLPPWGFSRLAARSLPALVLALAVASPLAAQEELTVALVAVEGPSRRPVGREVRRALSAVDGVEVVPRRVLLAASREEGADLDDLAVLRRVEADLAVTAVTSRPNRRLWEVTLVARSARDGRVLASRVVDARTLGRAARPLRAAAREVIEDARHELSAPAEPPPEAAVEAAEEPVSPDVDETPDAETAPVDAPRRSATDDPLLSLGIAGGFFNRNLTWSDDDPRLQAYTLAAGPLVRLRAELFFGQLLDDAGGPLSGLSFLARGEVVPGIRSEDERNVRFPTVIWGLETAVRWRVPIDDVSLGAELGYQTATFALRDTSDATRPDLPNVTYHALRLGALGRWRITDGLFASARLAYLVVLDSGEIAGADWFPRASTGGVDADVEIGWRIAELEVAATFGWRRFFHSLGAQPGDVRIAGGATDQAFLGAVALRVFIR